MKSVRKWHVVKISLTNQINLNIKEITFLVNQQLSWLRRVNNYVVTTYSRTPTIMLYITIRQQYLPCVANIALSLKHVCFPLSF